MTFQIWKPFPQGKKGQGCLGQDCAGGGRLGYLMGGESLCAGHCVLLLAPILTRQSMGAGGWTPHPRPSGALYSVRDIWSLPEPLQGFSLAGEGSRYLHSWVLGPRLHQDCPEAPSRTLGPSHALSSFGRTTNLCQGYGAVSLGGSGSLPQPSPGGEG